MSRALDSHRPARPCRPTPNRGRPPAGPEPGSTDGPSVGSACREQLPAWAVSLIVHVIALLGMALIVTEAGRTAAVIPLWSSAAEDEVVVDAPATDRPDEPVVDTTDPVADVAVATDPLVEDVAVDADSTDAAAQALSVEIADFGAGVAPASGMVSSVGAVAGGDPGFGNRRQAVARAMMRGSDGPTQAAVDRALKWFINHQMPDGGWSFDLANCPNCKGKCSHGTTLADRCAATALALLPFYGRGYTHKDGPYKSQLEAGIAFLAALSVKGEGQCYAKEKGGGSLYSQGLAGICLSEAYAMTQDNRLQGPAQMALYFIEQAQDPVGGGWRYQPRQPGDTSAVGWQLMALKSGNMAYLTVNAGTIKKAIAFLDSVEDDSGAYYGYMAPGKGYGTTAVGLLSRMYLGWKKDHPALQRGVEYLAKKGLGTDMYFNYYATQIMHHMEGDVWEKWNKDMKALLLPKQATEGHEAGSWFKGLDGGHGAHKAGRLYVTSLATMMLEVYYRHMPIYRNQVTEDSFRE